MRSLRTAVSFLTVLPVGPRDLSPGAALASARAYFPLVGLTLGGVLALLDIAFKSIFPPVLVNALLIAALIAMTRAIHTEGFMDACDALFGGYTRERRLEILRDPHVGAFAVIGGLLLLLIKWAAMVALMSPARLPALILFPGLGRWGVLLVMGLYPYARGEGMGTAFQRGRSRWQIGFGLLIISAASMLLLGPAGVLLFTVGSGIAWMIGRWMAGLLGGLTGDAYGAVNETVEVVVLLAATAIFSIAPSLFRPIWTLGS